MKIFIIVLALLQVLAFSWETHSLSHFRNKRSRNNRKNRRNKNNPQIATDPVINPIVPTISPGIQERPILNKSYNF